MHIFISQIIRITILNYDFIQKKKTFLLSYLKLCEERLQKHLFHYHLIFFLTFILIVMAHLNTRNSKMLK